MMKKFIAVLMTVVMVFSAVSLVASAAEKYEVTFEDFPYDITEYRSDYIGKYMGYDYGTDYWFTITNSDGTTTDIKGFPYSVTVYAGDYLEFTVSVASYVEPGSVRMLAYPTSLDINDLYDEATGEPDSSYYIAKSSVNRYGLRPTQDLTVCLSEYHLYNDCFLYDFQTSDTYKTARVMYDPSKEGIEAYSAPEWGNTKVIYINETLFFEVIIPMDGRYDYHYETYQVYYTIGTGNNKKTVYLKKNASEDGTDEAIDKRMAHDIVENEGGEMFWVDVYAIENVSSPLNIKVVNTVTYTISMLKQFLDDFSFENISDIDFSTLDLSPMFEYIVRLLNLLVKILKGFGLNIEIGDLIH